ncbi:MAG: sigma-70 family RNA polymerase sigma factor [Anaerolineaceae bacterium]|nr:sigma-70 family RNA polymerase sigma factor [Anaerolineaceae bacterium]
MENIAHKQTICPVQDEDEALIRRAKRDPREFDALYRRYLQPVYRYLYSRLGSVEDAEDATAQTFLSAFEGFDRYRHDGHFAAWLFSIARRKAADIFRKSSMHDPLDDTLRADGGDMLGGLMDQERSIRLKALVASLPVEEIELLQLRFAADLSFAEIASVLERKEDAVKKSLYRLLDRLQEKMEVSNEQ